MPLQPCVTVRPCSECVEIQTCVMTDLGLHMCYRPIVDPSQLVRSTLCCLVFFCVLQKQFREGSWNALCAKESVEAWV